MNRTLIITAGAAAVLAAVSCQKEMEVLPQEGAVMSEAWAGCPPRTKVAFDEDAAGDFQGTWEVGDIVFGFKEDGTPFDFSVTSVDAEGTAALAQISETTFTVGETIYAIHSPGKTSADLSGTSLKVDFSMQPADVIPVLMLSKAVVTEGPSVTFKFSNAASIVAVVAPVLTGELSEGKAVVKATLSGHEIVSSGTVSLSGGEISFEADAPKNFIQKTLNAPAVANDAETYTISDPVYIVVPASKVAKLSLQDNKGGFFEYTIDKTAETSKYYRISGKTLDKVDLPSGSTIEAGGVEWSRWNLGGNSPTSAGNLYRWSDTGIIYTAVTSSTITMDDAHQAGFVNYLGEIYCTDATTGSETYSKYNEAGLVLDPIDDIVQLTYPGTGWRMPTIEEFTALAGLKDDASYTITLNDNGFIGIKYTRNEDGATVLLRGNQPCVTAATTTKVNQGRYWTASSRVESAALYTAQYFQVVISSNLATGEYKTGNQRRFFGYSIRPVKPVE